MPAFTSARSTRVLGELDERLQAVCNKAIRRIDFSLISGLRTTQEQQALYAATPRTTQIDGVIKRSRHQAGVNGKAGAFDFIPAPWSTTVGWYDRPVFTAYAHYFIGIGDTLGIPIRWGGDWNGDFRWKDQTFHDFPHIELIDWPQG